MERDAALRSGTMSCTAPKACAAMPHRKKADEHDARVPVVTSAPASARPTTAGLTKCVLDVTRVQHRTLLEAQPGAEYATTANRLTARRSTSAGPPADEQHHHERDR